MLWLPYACDLPGIVWFIIFGVCQASCVDTDSNFSCNRLLLAGEEVQSLLRGTDLVGRLSEGELVLALPESGGRETRRIAARILRALDAAEHGHTVNRLAYAVSPGEGRTLRALLDAARTRLDA